jgi:Spy/CpxP family protein refolding chaperone
MRHIHTLIVCALLGATSASAQPPGPPRHFGIAGDIDRLAVLLDLDAYQKDQVQSILNAQREQLQAQRKAHEEAGERPSFDEVHAQREQAYNDTLTKLSGVLTELQMTKFKLLTERPMGPGPGGRRGPRPPAEGAQPVAPQ